MKANKMIHRSARAAIKLLLAALLPATAQTAWAWDGEGSLESPYQIKNASDLVQLAIKVNSGTGDADAASGYEGKYFVLTNDLYYSHKADGKVGADTENNYTAIGYKGHPFMGYFDGQGHTVSGIRIYNSGTNSYQGLFGFISVGAEVKNVTLANARITGYYYTGGIVGWNDGGAVTNCHVLSDVTIHAVKDQATCHGGIVGENDFGTVSGCTSAARITTTASVCYGFGGVVGCNKGTVCDCLYLGTTIEGEDYVGAIVGYNVSAYVTVQNCYFTSTTITGKDGSGGTLANADCAVGRNENGGTVAANVGLARTVSAGTGVTINAIALTGTATHYDEYHNIITAYSGGGIAYAGNRYYGNGCTVSLTLSNAGEAPAGYQYAGAYTASAGTLSGNATDGYTLAMPDADVTISAVIAPDPDHFSVSGDEYTIKTPAGWGVFCDALQDNTTYNRFSGKTVRLGADIAVTRMAGSQYHDFCGTFDGGGNTLTVTLSGSSDRMAPFSYISNVGSAPAAIRNLNVVADITSSGQKASALVGEAWGELTIEQCTVSGTVAVSKQFAGGIIGSASNTPLNITDCRSSVTISSSISGDGTHGGFAGRVPSSATLNISGCVFDGKIITTSGTTHCGGFVGHSENTDGNNVTITNSLYAPADIDDGETEALTGNVENDPSCTFARNVIAENITNSYYTRLLGTAQGKQPRVVSAGQNVTISNVALTGSATTYDVSGITAYTGGGLTRTVDQATTLYYGQGDVLSLTLQNPQPAGVTLSKYTATGGTLSSNDTDGYTLTMPDKDVTIDATWKATYIDEFGEQQSHDVTLLKGTETSLSRGWYVATGTLNYTKQLKFTGNANIILADDCQMNVGSSDSRINNIGILGYDRSKYYSLAIYGQYAGTGALNVYTTGESHDGIAAYAIAFNGGNITADANGSNSSAIVSQDNGHVDSYVIINGGNITANGSKYGVFAIKNVIICGGNVSATGGNYGINTSNGNITLGWKNPTDRIYASSYHAGSAAVTIDAKKPFIDEDGTLHTASALGTIAGKTLYPYVATLNLAARQAPDRNYWTTFYCGHTSYEISADENACAYTAEYDAENAQLILHNQGKQIPKGCAVIIVADPDNSSIGMTAATLDAFTGNNALSGVDQDTPLDDLTATLGEGTLYVLGMTTVNNEQHFGFHRYTGAEMAARKAFLLLPASQAGARSLDMVFEDATGVNEVIEDKEVTDDSWYTINGVKLNGKPTKSGLYINKGMKVVIK